MDIRITKYCHIKDKRILVNGVPVFEDPGTSGFGEFVRAAYKYAGMTYAKFYKMDDLCKLALVSAEILLKDTGIVERYGKENVGVILQNSSSTIDTDQKFQSTIDDRNNYFPSPADFVYTLPNIMIGEICIRHRIFGENALFIEERFDPEELARYLTLLFEKGRINAAIAGRVEQQGNDHESFIYLAEANGPTGDEIMLKHDAESIHAIYDRKNNN
jgi:hypothetical protein